DRFAEQLVAQVHVLIDTGESRACRHRFALNCVEVANIFETHDGPPDVNSFRISVQRRNPGNTMPRSRAGTHHGIEGFFPTTLAGCVTTTFEVIQPRASLLAGGLLS